SSICSQRGHADSAISFSSVGGGARRRSESSRSFSALLKTPSSASSNQRPWHSGHLSTTALRQRKGPMAFAQSGQRSRRRFGSKRSVCAEGAGGFGFIVSLYTTRCGLTQGGATTGDGAPRGCQDPRGGISFFFRRRQNATTSISTLDWRRVD